MQAHELVNLFPNGSCIGVLLHMQWRVSWHLKSLQFFIIVKKLSPDEVHKNLYHGIVIVFTGDDITKLSVALDQRLTKC